MTLSPRYSFRYPVYAECISPDIFVGKSLSEILELEVWEGNKRRSLGSLFDVECGDANESENVTLQIRGDLRKVRMVGAEMTIGTIVIEGDVGLRLGEYMKGGEIIVKGNVDSWAGSSMEGGRIEVNGSAADYVGGPYRGSTEGMKNGSVLIHGDAGNEVGCYMRGGLLKVDGSVGDFAGIHMRDGTILIQGDSKCRPGAGMLDGRVIICGRVESILPTFTIDSIRPTARTDGEKVTGPFYLFTGDIADDGKGRLFIAKDKNPHLSFYEKYL